MFAELNLPGPAHLARHALPRLVEGTVIPLALFYGGLQLLGLGGALAASLVWCLAALLWRAATKRPVSALLLLSAAGLVARSALALATGSVFIYFLQPSLGTLLVGFVFLASVPMGGQTLADWPATSCRCPTTSSPIRPSGGSSAGSACCGAW